MNAITPIVERIVDNPLDTDAQIYARQTVGKITVSSNELTRIGALCFLPQRELHHEKSAERFKNEYEALYGSVSPAVDPAREPVQSSPTAHDNGMAARIDRADSIRRVLFGSKNPPAPPVLDKDEVDLVLECICMGVRSSWMVDKLPNGKPNSRQVQHLNRRILYLLKKLSIWWGYVDGREAA